jgi:hypothetical protein
MERLSSIYHTLFFLTYAIEISNLPVSNLCFSKLTFEIVSSVICLLLNPPVLLMPQVYDFLTTY